MKKILLIIIIALIPIVVIVGGLYVYGNVEKNKIIKEVTEEIKDPYYNNLARQCSNEGGYKCCLASVYDMIDVQARLATEKECENLRKDSLKCVGSYKWCIPMTDVTSI